MERFADISEGEKSQARNKNGLFSFPLFPVLCPVGTFLAKDTGECTMCEEGFFQDLEGQEHCARCAEGFTSQVGAYMRDMCE